MAKSASTPIHQDAGWPSPPRGAALATSFVASPGPTYAGQILAGVTLVAIAIPEQLATSQLAGVPAFLALIAFIAATLVFVLVGSNPIVSVGADSTIAPLFAVVLIRLRPRFSTLVPGMVAVTRS